MEKVSGSSLGLPWSRIRANESCATRENLFDGRKVPLFSLQRKSQRSQLRWDGTDEVAMKHFRKLFIIQIQSCQEFLCFRLWGSPTRKRRNSFLFATYSISYSFCETRFSYKFLKRTSRGTWQQATTSRARSLQQDLHSGIVLNSKWD